MKQVISLSYGEVALKGGNRRFFVDRLMRNLKLALRDFDTDRIYQDRTKVLYRVSGRSGGRGL